MRADDLDQVIEIENESHAYPWTLGIFGDCLRVGYSCWSLVVGEELLGYGVMSAAVGEAHVLNICVRGKYQRQGYGRQILSHLIDVARVHSCDTMLLEVRPSNQGAIALYKDEGFQEVGHRNSYYPARNGREDALILARSIA
ncbi:MAG TPA: ribosomal-protein-alanine N-acetyltransferase [Chromatiaceae bacterium]|nr:ribosomal-protein-alanine N-acetyltransferase [Chromatiaceae bacterium]HIB84943.1 ribosomal-protein-alanine N-acetyltransferase [Chromatiaceae bacterium]HIN82969.1 ribosomal-protein-alanine N-acetyltransferase [Chromatiales bacterium]HIO14216.1 ribosomal-protein-alanine N-acetyltransferase [Chromatiales bacterium]HIO54590.1 ribosomal-protein-alanine N-acetyltransferase [Chromatiales bacterium]